MLDFGSGAVVHAEALDLLGALPDGSVDLCYVDPPFNTGRPRRGLRLHTVHDEGGGDRTGFGGRPSGPHAHPRVTFPGPLARHPARVPPPPPDAAPVLSRHAP